MYGIAAFLAGRFFAGKWRETNLSTPAEFVKVRFSKKAFNFHTAYRGAYLAMTGGLYERRVRLSELRRTLSDIPRQTLDDTLLELDRSRRIQLMSMEQPTDISEDDRNAEITIGGRPRHVLYLSS